MNDKWNLALCIVVVNAIVLSEPALAQSHCSDPNPNISIPDNNPVGVSDSLVISGTSATVGDLVVSIEISHTWVGDLVVVLDNGAGPGGPVMLFDRPGVPASAAGCPFDDINAKLADTGNSIVCHVAVPSIAGCIEPEQGNLSDFNGAPLDATWTLTVSDHAMTDQGTLNRWCINNGPVKEFLGSPEFTMPNGAPHVVAGSGNLSVAQTATSLNPTSDGFVYTDATLTYSPVAGESVVIGWEISRPFSMCGGPSPATNQASIAGSIAVTGNAAISDVTLIQNTTSVPSFSPTNDAIAPINSPGGTFSVGPIAGASFMLPANASDELKQAGEIRITVPSSIAANSTYAVTIPGSFDSELVDTTTGEPVPAVSTWGLIVTILLFAGSFVLLWRRRSSGA